MERKKEVLVGLTQGMLDGLESRAAALSVESGKRVSRGELIRKAITAYLGSASSPAPFKVVPPPVDAMVAVEEGSDEYWLAQAREALDQSEKMSRGSALEAAPVVEQSDTVATLQARIYEMETETFTPARRSDGDAARALMRRNRMPKHMIDWVVERMGRLDCSMAEAVAEFEDQFTA